MKKTYIRPNANGLHLQAENALAISDPSFNNGDPDTGEIEISDEEVDDMFSKRKFFSDNFWE